MRKRASHCESRRSTPGAGRPRVAGSLSPVAVVAICRGWIVDRRLVQNDAVESSSRALELAHGRPQDTPVESPWLDDEQHAIDQPCEQRRVYQPTRGRRIEQHVLVPFTEQPNELSEPMRTQ